MNTVVQSGSCFFTDSKLRNAARVFIYLCASRAFALDYSHLCEVGKNERPSPVRDGRLALRNEMRYCSPKLWRSAQRERGAVLGGGPASGPSCRAFRLT
jgi:hypothetical protein